MPRLLFFSRVALICNGCFLVTFLMHYLPFLGNGIVPSTIIILGNVLSIVLNVIVNLLYLVLSLSGKPVGNYVPLWLFMLNFLFFIFQIILLVK